MSTEAIYGGWSTAPPQDKQGFHWLWDVLSAQPERPNFGLTQRKNEIFVDIYERISITFNVNGYILNSNIDGTIQMKSYLAGNPELKLALNEYLVIGGYIYLTVLETEDAGRTWTQTDSGTTATLFGIDDLHGEPHL